MEPREYGGESLSRTDGCMQANPKATAIVSQAVVPTCGAFEFRAYGSVNGAFFSSAYASR